MFKAEGPEPKFIQVHPNILTRGHTRRFNTERMLTALEDRKISLVLNVSPRADVPLAAGCRTVGIEYKHAPLPDGKNIDVALVSGLVYKVIRDVRNGLNVVVHCNAGRNRTFLIVIPAIATLTGRLTSVVLPEIAAIRPRLLANPVFEDFVVNWEVK
jgi:protein-tyrosine phosphatase